VLAAEQWSIKLASGGLQDVQKAAALVKSFLYYAVHSFETALKKLIG
jgi:hypothetical protein